MRRLPHQSEIDKADRIRRPFDLIIKLGTSKADYSWGRWADPSRAHQAGHELLRETRKNYMPFSKPCRSYLVVDTRTGQSVSDPGLLDRIETDRQVAA